MAGISRSFVLLVRVPLGVTIDINPALAPEGMVTVMNVFENTWALAEIP
jgi:hypothetical protein